MAFAAEARDEPVIDADKIVMRDAGDPRG